MCAPGVSAWASRWAVVRCGCRGAAAPARSERLPSRAGAPRGSGLRQLLDQLPRLTLIVGKGGVGKTTCAAGIAAAFAARGRRTLLLSTDPAGSLGRALGIELSADGAVETAIAGHSNLFARQLSAAGARSAFLALWRDVIVEIVDRGTYLDLSDVQGLVDAALPGADEIFALLALAELVSDHAADSHQQLVVDTAPTGHTVRLLQLPETFAAMLALLDTMQEKHRFMVRTLTRQYRGDRADAFLMEMRSTLAALRSALGGATHCAALLVTRAEPVVHAETLRYAASLQQLGISVAAVVVNAVSEVPHETELRELARTHAIAPQAAHLVLPLLAEPPLGLAALDRAIRQLSVLPDGATSSGGRMRGARKRWDTDAAQGVSWFSGGAPRPESTVLTPTVPASLLRTLTFAGGKGGVGKTTVSCALGIAAADASSGDQRILLVSTDPAPSIADALEQPIEDRETLVVDVPGLVARQVDAASAFRGLRERHRARIDALFDTFVAHGVDATHDRAILRDLLALAPPGIDELFALTLLGDTLAQGQFDRIIVDPAPTGHLLRLLEMPALALEWSHLLMRMMLKYKEVAGLGEAAEELLGFARRTRALQTMLHDPARSGIILVALDEPLVRSETARLAAALDQASVAVAGVAWNRIHDSGDHRLTPLPTPAPLPQFLAPAVEAPLVGVGAIRAWLGQWRRLEPQ